MNAHFLQMYEIMPVQHFIAEFKKTNDLLINAIMEKDDECIKKLDQKITVLMDIILDLKPSTPMERQILVMFLLNHLKNEHERNANDNAICRKIMSIIK